ncbi:helix-turn-helix transcriptional regulator [Streptomyces sp. NPDC086182]|uniref:helix-turn-helix transcriptional regulator n=1 Tax=Streptomyces sp. NPDC086182 TaxID=3155058 RepID=UPI0034444C2F
MSARSPEIGPAGIRTARTLEIRCTERRLAQRELPARATGLGRSISNPTLFRVERAQRRCDIDDLVVIAEALLVSPLGLPQRPTATCRGPLSTADRTRPQPS